MPSIVVCGDFLIFGDRRFRCVIGKGGFSADKREGDGATPLGVFTLRECWYRADRMSAPETALPLRVIEQDDGWCDDPKSPNYNQHVKVPYSYSHEKLWRAEHVYDLIVPLGYNDDPAVPGKGSAIFLHVAKLDYAPTEGCVALALPDFLEVLGLCHPGMAMEIRNS